MFHGNLSDQVVIEKVLVAQATGTSTLETASVSTAGFAGIVFVGTLGSFAVNNTLRLRQSLDDVTFNDVGNAFPDAPTADGNSFSVDLYEQDIRLGPYIRLQIVRGTTTTVGEVYAIKYGSPRKVPTTPPATHDRFSYVGPSAV